MLNQAILVGRIVNNPELEMEGDSKFLELDIAVQRSYKNEEGVYETDVIPVLLTGYIAENTMEYCKKGDLVGIKGRIETNTNLRGDTKIRVIAEKVSFLSSRDAD